MTAPQAPDPQFRRLTTWPFPAYRFVPGRFPHPERDPAGHSYNVELPPLNPEARGLVHDWRQSPHFCFAVDCYNHAYWFEAHMYLEALWHCFGESDPARHALQTLVQVSAAHLVQFLEKPAAAGRLIAHAWRHLETAGGAGVRQFDFALGAWFAERVVPYFSDPGRVAYPFLDLDGGE